MANKKCGLVIMASGLGKRFGGGKLMAEFGGKPLIRWIIDATEGAFYRRVVVTRSLEVKSLCEELGVECIFHTLPGRNDTIRLGLERIKDDVDICFFGTADQPLIKHSTVVELVTHALANPDSITRPCHGELEGMPTGFPKSVYQELLRLPEGKGGNVVIKNHMDLVSRVFVSNECELRDADTKEELEELKKYINL